MVDLDPLSVIAIVVSLASVIFVVLQFGVSLGLEFVEKEEVRKMKNKIDGKLREELVAKLEDSARKVQKGAGDLEEELIELGEVARCVQVASVLLEVLRNIIFSLVKLVLLFILGVIVLILCIFAAVSYPRLIPAFGAFAGGVFCFVAVGAATLRDKILGYIFLRSQFYELYEEPSLSKARSIINELKKRGLVYV